MRNLIPPIQESDLPFPYKDEIILNEGIKFGDPEKTFHKIHTFGVNPDDFPGLFPSNHPYIKAEAYKLILNHLENYQENIIKMLDIKKSRNKNYYWRGTDIKSAEELSLKWINTYSQNHFIPTFNLIFKNISLGKHVNILELGTGTGLFSLMLIDQLLKHGSNRFTLITADFNVSCITFAWMVKQFFAYRDMDIHSYVFTKDNIDKEYIESIKKRHPRSIIFLATSFSEALDIVNGGWADLVVSNHGTSYLKNKDYKNTIQKISSSLKEKGVFVEDSLNQYKLNVQSKRLIKRVVLGSNRKKGQYETEYTVVQNEREVPTIIDIKDPNIDKACDWIRSMTFNPSFKSEYENFQYSLGKTQKTQRTLNPIAIDHSEEFKHIEKYGIKDVTPKDFKTDLYISTKIFQKV